GLLARLDANDTLYALESSRDYDPGPGLEKIRAPLLAINFADDLINPPELGILEREIRRVTKGQALVVPASKETVGHGTHTRAAVWKEHLVKLLRETEGSEGGNPSPPPAPSAAPRVVRPRPSDATPYSAGRHSGGSSSGPLSAAGNTPQVT